MATSLVPSRCDISAGDLAQLRERVERRLNQLVPLPQGGEDLIGVAMHASVLSPGKRVRPLMLVLAAQGLGHTSEALIDLGCAVEMVHAASLVLDDMPCMDDAQLRRGQPTVHVRYGEDVAMLAAVALLSQAFRTLVAVQGLPPLLKTNLVAALSDAVGAQGLVRGQYQDLHDGSRQRPASDIAGTNHLKTGALFGAALDMAAQVAQAGEPVRTVLRDFAVELGQAFQLLDDLGDCEADVQSLGKDCGKDQGKSTLVSVLGHEAARHRLRGHIQRAEALLAEVYGHDSPLQQLLAGLFRRVA
ncbi:MULTISPECIES: polyprenyl synthetase family protein [Pseudomonas]|uniref:polyprenyl synthetase family protein n=1 Tax=Pseudomonas TaxID=286 RepID=UPI00257BB12D|nr:MULTISPECIES: polyprenyl synthetase family protein [Pseudomonas]